MPPRASPSTPPPGRAAIRITIALAWALLASGLVPAKGVAAPPDAGVDSSGTSFERVQRLAPGPWRRLRSGRPGLTPAQQALIEKLEAIGYLAGTKPAGEDGGVTTYDEDRCWTGLNLCTSGHGPVAYLMDMDGEVLHRWTMAFDEVWPDRPVPKHPVARLKTTYWRRVRALPDGGLLAIFEGLGMIRLDAQSNLLWESSRGEHHDLQVLDDGRIVTLTREAHVVPRIGEAPILEDFVEILDADGNLLRKVSLLECFENSDFTELWRTEDPLRGDIFHTNTVHVLDGSVADVAPAFTRGRILTSMRKTDVIAVVDLDERRVEWARRGVSRAQHDPRITPEGGLLLFDNLGAGTRSTVREFDPATFDTIWEFSGTEGDPLVSGTCGAAQRLPNGNTLVTETDGGRALEVTREGDVVWEYVNPHRAGDEDEFIAALFEVERLPAGFGEEWWDADGAE